MKTGDIVWIKGIEMFGKILSFDKFEGKFNVRGMDGRNFKLRVGQLMKI